MTEKELFEQCSFSKTAECKGTNNYDMYYETYKNPYYECNFVWFGNDPATMTITTKRLKLYIPEFLYEKGQIRIRNKTDTIFRPEETEKQLEQFRNGMLIAKVSAIQLQKHLDKLLKNLSE